MQHGKFVASTLSCAKNVVEMLLLPYLVGVAEAKVDDLKAPAICRRLQEEVFRLKVSVSYVVHVQVLDSVNLFDER